MGKKVKEHSLCWLFLPSLLFPLAPRCLEEAIPVAKPTACGLLSSATVKQTASKVFW